MKIMVLMPLHKSMNTSCVISLVDFVQHLHIGGHKAKMVFVNGFNAARARLALSKHVATEGKGYDYVIWLDSDHVYKKDDLMKLMRRMKTENLKMLSACYKLHGSPDTVHGITENKVFRHFKEKELKKKLIDCQVVGFGFLLMKRSYLKRLWDKYGDELFVLDAKENCTEDVKFCKCVLDDGERVCFDPTVKVGHVETAVRY